MSDLKTKAIKLRTDERLSLREIHTRTGASKSSLSSWLKDHPLTKEEKQERQKKTKTGAPKKNREPESKFHIAVDSKKLTSLQKAKIAEAAILFRLVLHGFTPFGSVFDGDKVDWMVEVPTGQIYRIQVRWTKRNKGHGLPYVNLTCTEGHDRKRKFKPEEFDFIVGYDFYSDTAYVWSYSDVNHLKTAVTINENSKEAWHKLKGS